MSRSTSRPVVARRGRRNAPAIMALGLILAGGLIGGAAAQDAAVRDPLQKVNRASFGFSMVLDRLLIGPISHVYKHVVPAPVRNRVSAAVENLGTPSTALNDIAQGHPKRAAQATSRFVINSTVGVLGLFDVASKMDLPAHSSDFGQTLGRYGVKPGAYLYVPVLGPMNLRDGLGRVVDFVADPVTLAGPDYTTTFDTSRLAVTTLDTRTNADGAFNALDDATDPYATFRSAYAQNRAAVVREATGEAEVLPDFDAPPAEPPTPQPVKP